MRLLIDAGNTRIKWAVLDRATWLGHAALPVGLARELPRAVSEHLGRLALNPRDIQQIWVSNVAGAEIAQAVAEIRAGRPNGTHFIVAREQQCGVRNGYTDPGQLGSDRWAALIAAWHLARGACLVVDCGTAITIDALSAQGEFRGGLILPGPDLMQRSLAGATSQLGTQQGKYAAFPLNTADALHSGAIQACCGAIERQYALLENGSAPVILSGGAAGLLQQHIELPLQAVDDLVLQGLLLIAGEAGGT